MAIIKLYFAVNNISDMMERYDQIRIYRCITGVSGTYTLLDTISLETGKSLYTYYDGAGAVTYWYKSAYYNSGSAVEASLSDPYLGDDSEVLSYVMDVQRLKDVYLTGVDLTDDQGVPFPNIMFEFGIRAAIARVERELEIDTRPTERIEFYDYNLRDYQTWMFLALDHYPLISCEYVKLRWPSSGEAIEFPAAWISLQHDSGQLNLVPTSGTLAQALLTLSGSFLPFILGSHSFLPNAVEVKYIAGFAAGTLPYDIRDVIGMLACFPIMNTAGDLIAGAGIANYSLSMDSLSQSIGTTSSATNSGYGARLLQMEKKLKEDMPKLRKFYKGIRIAMG